eukprot:TRINITY_DN7109_c0_g1_i3.p1 TRINITY_DN7109_c0_g1~~TRINITY_DN7109_c0_g1_i3.p1  ORF type:complete len:1657 (-),score=378.22 TRINITY_DN7109_c0_g1_i3:147-5117(-)
MQGIRTVITLWLLSLANSVSGLVVCPSTLSAGQTYYCFFSVTGQEEAPSQLELLRDGVTQAVATQDAQNKGLYALPVPEGAAAGTYVVQSPGGSSSAKVTVAAKASLLLLEADRALYKPGSTARFRVLALSPGRLQPQKQVNVKFEVTSPEGFKLLEVVASTDGAGVAQFDFPIAQEPLLGAHGARASLEDAAGQGAGAMAEATFTVEEYVLPRFEVNLTVDQSFLSVGSGYSGGGVTVAVSRPSSPESISDQSSSPTELITGKVSAMFTFGESVAGTASVVVWAPINPWEQVSSSSKDGASSEKGAAHKALASINGLEIGKAGPAKFEVPVPADALQSGTELVVEATVVYDATTEQQSGTQRVPVRYKGSELQAHLSLSDGLGVFRPGLPSSIRVELIKPDGQAPSAEELDQAGLIELVVESSSVNWQQRVDPSRYSLAASSFVNGALTMEVPTSKESLECCDITASRTTWEEYQKVCGCCVTTLNFYIERTLPGEKYASRIWSAPSGKSPSACAARAYSPKGDYLSVSAPSQVENVWSSLLRSTLDPSKLAETVEYMVSQAGSVVGSATLQLTSSSFTAKEGYWEAQLGLELSASLSGDLTLLVITRPKDQGHAMAASAKFSRSLQLPFALSASFSASEVKPGAGLSLQLEAGPVGSTGAAPRAAHAFVASLDRSAELLGQRAAIGGPAILAALGKAAKGAEATPVAAKPWQHCDVYGDDIMVVAEMPDGVQIVADASGQVSVPDDSSWGKELPSRCPRPLVDGFACGMGGVGGPVMMEMDGVPMMAMAEAAPAAGGAVQKSADSASSSDSDSGGSASGSTVTVRKFFPETWLWTDMALDAGSSVASGSLSVTAPDTITSWSLEAFATSEDGVSAVRAETPLRVFKPFFVEVRLPYAAVRGEDLEVTIAVFNYVTDSGSLDASLNVELPPEVELVEGQASQQLSPAEGSAASITLRVRAKELGTWKLKATATATSGSQALGDAMEKPLLVRPEGIAMSQTQNLVVDLSGGPVSDSLALSLPESAVSGSARLAVSTVGDLLGPTISGLERLLQIPTGCGEQNMITLAPNVYVAKYLLAVGKMRPDLRQRIVNNIITGYGRQLTYRHNDGSFSAFGTSDPSGSTWLTAFVLRIFAEVAGTGLVAVDSTVLSKASEWLVSLQERDGSFRSVGNVIHQEMMGGTSGSSALPLTAYVASALAKAKTEVPSLASSALNSALEQAAQYLSESSAIGTYTALLRAHALALANLWTDEQVAAEALKLSTDAGSGRRFWSNDAGSGTSTQAAAKEAPGARGYGSGVVTLDVEMTGYGTLALTLAGRLTEAFEGARWLLERRSASGGFSSTQDTVVALNALATYATAAGRNVDLQLQVSDGGSFQQTVQIDSANMDVLQTMSLPAAPGALSVNVEATGQGVALVTAQLSYNLPESAVEPCYDLEVSWFGAENDLRVSVRGCSLPRAGCAAKEGAMSIMSIGLFTGYAASTASLESLREAKVIKRYELADGKVDLYLEAMSTTEKTCAQFNVTKEFKVWNTQAAVSEVYDYYAPEARGESLSDFKFQVMSGDVAQLPGTSTSIPEGTVDKEEQNVPEGNVDEEKPNMMSSTTSVPEGAVDKEEQNGGEQLPPTSAPTSDSRGFTSSAFPVALAGLTSLASSITCLA